ncbi:MAG: FAD-dependent oxidoreductase [Puniceicoccales bacterium]|jgi:lysophospholipase L1-like esterase|nr:FAD-dependent oxidoreductase [Puniceicoccales bacterium]
MFHKLLSPLSTRTVLAAVACCAAAAAAGAAAPANAAAITAAATAPAAAPAAAADSATYLRDTRALLQKQWPRNRAVNLVFHGHSVPAGYFKTPAVDSFHAYPLLTLQAVKAAYPYAVINAINTAIGGENAEQGARRFKQEVLVHRPDVLFIDYALNDRGLGLKRARAAWVHMIEHALALKIKVILLTPTPDQSTNVLDANSPLEQHARQIRALAAQYGVGLADSYAAFGEIAKRGESIKPYMSQINHPNARGHSIVADLLAAWLLPPQKTATNAVLIEAESFAEKGGWVVDAQFSDLMGSPYLMAHGLGKPVKDAVAKIKFPQTGKYRLFVRTYNWTAPWSDAPGAGVFQVKINAVPATAHFGATGKKWAWQDGGEVEINKPETEIALADLTGFNGRCDALFFTQDKTLTPPDDAAALAAFRQKLCPQTRKDVGQFDFVVVGGGVAGMCAAVASARQGLKVAIIQDRPIWGGNNSSEVRVHLGGRLALPPYPNLGGIVAELSPKSGGNAKPASQYEDKKKHNLMDAETNISQFLNHRVFAVEMDGRKIKSVTARHVETGQEVVFHAPIFADCTGDGTVGALAGADFAMGREGKKDFGEPTAPAVGDKMTMGSSVQWYSTVAKTGEPAFPVFKHGLLFNEQSSQKVTMGEWTWETGMHLDQVRDFERIRDYGMLVVFSNWSFLKNEHANKQRFANRELGWVAYVAGKRESRRLLGDIILREQDIKEKIQYPDGTASTSWSIDLHYPDPANTKYFPNGQFKAIAKTHPIKPYPIPYRCFYSRNTENLFMAGRNISVTHVALGTVRVMRTTGMMGEVVGLAASLCKKHSATPRGVYEKHLEDLKTLMRLGAGKVKAASYPKYN